MERQRSFSLKRTRFFLFSSTISSIIFLTLLSIWVFKTSPLVVNQETHFQFNEIQPTSLTFALKPPTLSRNSSNPSVHMVTTANPNLTHLPGHLNSSETAKISSRFDGFPRKATGIKLPNLDSVSVAMNPSRFGEFPRKTSAIKQPNLDSVSVAMNPSDGQNTSLDSVLFEGMHLRNEVELQISSQKPGLSTSEDVDKTEEEKGENECDVTIGKWVFDESYPLYTAATCPFIDEGFNCEGNGRMDKDYMKWRWQPQDCDIPRFNATKMLELFRGKRLVFVGDSINRNQWESMLCLLMNAIKDPKRVYETHGRRITKDKGNYCFKFLDYKCTVEYYVSHFLVHEGKARVGRRHTQTLRIDTVDRGSSRWRGADVLIFNTAHWWSHYKTQSGVNYYQEGDQVIPRLDVLTAFRKAMVTWASWVDKHINPRKTRVVFRSSAPSHFNGGEWNAGGQCKEASQPLNRTARTTYPAKNIIVEKVLREMKTPTTFLNITSLSDYRRDGHPSIHGRRGGNSLRGEDCSHWCLPGVPDTWNQLLYYHLQS